VLEDWVADGEASSLNCSSMAMRENVKELIMCILTEAVYDVRQMERKMVKAIELSLYNYRSSGGVLNKRTKK